MTTTNISGDVPSIEEKDFFKQSAYNWGKKQHSKSRNGRTEFCYRYCNGVYICKNSCVKAEKRKPMKHCPHCENPYMEIQCSGKVNYKLVNNKVVHVQYSSDIHVCVTAFSENAVVPADLYQEVDKIPFDVDGDVKYKLHITDSDPQLKKAADGRHWAPKYVALTKKTDRLSIYRKTCMGDKVCENTDCKFLKEYECANRHQTQKEGSGVVCNACGTEMTSIQCPATKTYIQSRDNPAELYVQYKGNHTCAAVPVTKMPEDEMRDIIHKLPTITPSQLVNKVVKDRLFNHSPEEANKVASSLAKKRSVIKFVANTRKTMSPSGTGFAAVKALKNKLEQEPGHDKLMISHVDVEVGRAFTTSKEKLKMMTSLCEEEDGFLHVDFQANRVKNIPVMTFNCYRPMMKKVVNIAKLYTKGGETAEEVEFGFEMLNELLLKENGKKVSLADLSGLMADESGPVQKGLAQYGGTEFLEKLASCSGHYYFGLQHRKRDLKGPEYMEFCIRAAKLQKSCSAGEYGEAKEAMENFIETCSNPGRFIRWLEWWDVRKQHWCLAFQAPGAPQSNLSEAQHASDSALVIGSSQTLLEALKADCAEAVMLKAQIAGLKDGTYKGGAGLSQVDSNQKTSIQAESQLQGLAKDIVTMQDTNVIPPTMVQSAPQVDPGASSSEAFRLDNQEEGTIPTFSDGKRGQGKRPRNKRSLTEGLKKKVSQAVSMRKHFGISEHNMNGGERERNFLVVHNQNTIERGDVKMSAVPECTCKFFISHKKRGELCWHILLVLLDMGVEHDDKLLAQIGYSEGELNDILKAKINSFKRPTTIQRSVKVLPHKMYLKHFDKKVDQSGGKGPTPCCNGCGMKLAEKGLVIEVWAKPKYGRTHQQTQPLRPYKYHVKDECLKPPAKPTDLTVLRGPIIASGITWKDLRAAENEISKYNITSI